MERIWRKNEKEIRTKKIMYPHLPDGDRSGYGADFYHADRSYHQQFIYVGSGDHLQLWFHFPENGYRGQAVHLPDGKPQIYTGYGDFLTVCDRAI